MWAGLLLLEALSLGLFAALLIRQQSRTVYARARGRLEYDSAFLATQAAEVLGQQRPDLLAMYVKMTVNSPTVETAMVTDPAGNVLSASSQYPNRDFLEPAERAQILLVKQQQPRVFTFDGDRWEGVCAIYTGNVLRGYAWVEFDHNEALKEFDTLLSDTAIFGIIWMAASTLLVLLIGRSISRPLAILHRGTRALMTSPGGENFPLPVTVHNEFGDLIEAFNRMVASIVEQRSGLNDTLSLLDSMLANAPIGLAFFDRACRFVRVNQVFADLTGVPLSRHLGRTLPELLPPPVAQDLENAVLRVFAAGQPVRNLELSGHGRKPAAAGKPSQPWTWLISAYPVHTFANQVRWAGVIVLDASDRKRSEEALRKTEKLAVAGRLAATIAHEINNPLEAVTNLLFLLRSFGHLDDPALNYVTMAEYEVRRIAEITQQTLRFYRQPTKPARANLAELLDPVLSLYQSRLNALDLHVERGYDPGLGLFCFAAEIRQVFANLVGNAIDATGEGGRLLLRAHRSRNWRNPAQQGIRFAFADTGAGMEPEVRERIFEAFFTTKEDTGTGLGLWVSHEILMKHHGVVHVRSRAAAQPPPPQPKSTGTVFEIFLPDDPNLGNDPNQR